MTLSLAAPAAADDPAPVLRLRTELGGGDLGWATLPAYAPDGKTVYSATWGPAAGRVYVIDPVAGKKLDTLTADPPPGTVFRHTTSLAVSPDGKWLAVAHDLAEKDAGAGVKDAGWELQLWDTAGRKLAARARGDRWVLSHLTFDPDGKRLAGTSTGYAKETDGYKSVATVWDVPGLKRLHAFEAQDRGHLALGFAREGGADVLRGFTNTAVLRWDLAAGKPLDPRPLQGKDRAWQVLGWYAAASPDGKTVAGVTEVNDANGLAVGAEVSLFDADKGGKARAVARGHRRGADRIAFSPDGKLLATASMYSGDTIVWDADNLAILATLPTYGQPAFAPDGKTLTVSGTGYWGTDGRHRFTVGRDSTQVWSVSFDPKGWSLASSSNITPARVWDLGTGKNTVLLPFDASTRTIRAVAFSPDGATVAATEGGTVKFFKADDGYLRSTATAHTSGVNAVAFSPDGKHFASASGAVRWKFDEPKQDPGEVIVWTWDREGGAKPLHTLKAHPAGTFALAWSPDGKTLATGGGEPAWGEVELPAGATKEAVRLWDVATGKQTAAFPCDPGHHVGALAWSPDGKTLAHTGIDGTRVRLLDPATGKERFLLSTPTQGLAFSPDGALLAAVGGGGKGNAHGLIELWDPATGKKVASVVGHEQVVNCVAFGQNGRTLATGSNDGVLNLWDVVPPRK